MELPGVPRDTAPNIERRLNEGLRRMSVTERLERTFALISAGEELVRAGIRLREGELSEEEVRRRIAELRYGRELVARAWAHRESRAGEDPRSPTSRP